MIYDNNFHRFVNSVTIKTYIVLSRCDQIFMKIRDYYKVDGNKLVQFLFTSVETLQKVLFSVFFPYMSVLV